MLYVTVCALYYIDICICDMIYSIHTDQATLYVLWMMRIIYDTHLSRCVCITLTFENFSPALCEGAGAGQDLGARCVNVCIHIHIYIRTLVLYRARLVSIIYNMYQEVEGNALPR